MLFDVPISKAPIKTLNEWCKLYAQRIEVKNGRIIGIMRE
jgi:hypothetical protein